MESQTNNLKEGSDGEETDDKTSQGGQFMNYENSVFRFRKQKKKKKRGSQITPEEQALLLQEQQQKQKAIRAEKLLEKIRSHTNQMSLWQSFPVSNNQHAVVFCYERDYLKAWLNLKSVSFNEHYQLTLTEQEIKLKTEENKNCCRKNMQGYSHTDMCRTYRVPKPMDFYKAVWHQTGDVLELCVPWSSPME